MRKGYRLIALGEEESLDDAHVEVLARGDNMRWDLSDGGVVGPKMLQSESLIVFED
jgi:hypothetical protein